MGRIQVETHILLFLCSYQFQPKEPVTVGVFKRSLTANDGYDIKKHYVIHRLLANQNSIFWSHWLLEDSCWPINTLVSKITSDNILYTCATISSFPPVLVYGWTETVAPFGIVKVVILQWVPTTLRKS